MYIELTGDTLQQIIQENDKVMVQYGDLVWELQDYEAKIQKISCRE